MEVIKQATCLLLSLLIGLAPLQSHAHALRLVLETNVKDSDTTRVAVDFGNMDFEELGHLPEKLEQHADILPNAQQTVIVHTFVPKDLPQQEKDEFVATVQEHLSKSHRKLTLKVVAVDFDPGPREEIFDWKDYLPPEPEVAPRPLTNNPPQSLSVFMEFAERHPVITSPVTIPLYAGTSLYLASHDYLRAARNPEYWKPAAWKDSFRQHVADYKRWLRSGFTRSKDFTIGGIIGYGRGALSAAVWFGTNRFSFPAFMQVGASAFLDWFFSKYEMTVDNFKSTHRLPGESIPYFGTALNWTYNNRPWIKSWVVGTIIGFVAANYFRYWSYVENPERTTPPWSGDALGTWAFGAFWGSVFGASGAMAPRILRKKGYIDSRTQYYIYSSFGFIFQLNGFLYGLGYNIPAVIVTTLESLTKGGMFLVAKKLPVKDPQAIVIHPAIGEKEVEEIYYRVGLYDDETLKFSARNFNKRVDDLKHGRCEEEVEAEN